MAALRLQGEGVRERLVFGRACASGILMSSYNIHAGPALHLNLRPTTRCDAHKADNSVGAVLEQESFSEAAVRTLCEHYRPDARRSLALLQRCGIESIRESGLRHSQPPLRESLRRSRLTYRTAEAVMRKT